VDALDGSWTDNLENLISLREYFEKIDAFFKRNGTKECDIIVGETL